MNRDSSTLPSYSHQTLTCMCTARETWTWTRVTAVATMILVCGDPRRMLTRLRRKKEKRSHRREDAKQQVNDCDGSLQSTKQVDSRTSTHSRELERYLLPRDPVVTCQWEGQYIQFHTTTILSSSQQGNTCRENDSSSKIEFTGLELQGTPRSSDWVDEQANNSYTIRLRGESLSSYYRAIKENPEVEETPREWLVPPEHR